METKFYCNKCRKEVAFNSVRCPYCGEHFDAVQCPVCRLIGTPNIFVRGCPSCGYINPQQEMSARAKMKKANAGKPEKKRQKKGLFHFYIPSHWYRILLLVFFLILLVLLYLVYRLV